MTGIDAVIFDKDGTLFDFTATWAPFTEAVLTDLSAGDPVLRDALAKPLGFDLNAGQFHPDSALIAGTPADAVAAIRSLLPDRDPAALEAVLVERARDQPAVPATDLGPLMRRLAAAGLTLGVVTNDGETAARAHLRAHGILDAFAFVAGYDSGHGEKPDPGPLQAFAATTCRAPERCVMVGDSLHDMRAARAAGMIAIGVLSGPATRDTLAPDCDAVLPHIGHLPGWLGLAAAQDDESD